LADAASNVAQVALQIGDLDQTITLKGSESLMVADSRVTMVTILDSQKIQRKFM
jgi:hypothetical protein